MMKSVLLVMLSTFLIAGTNSTSQASDRVYYSHNDHLGTPQAMSDASGRIVWTAEYDPFGKATVNEDPDGDGQTMTNNLRFPGQYYDAESGLHYNWNRYYDPGTGYFGGSGNVNWQPISNFDTEHDIMRPYDSSG